MRVSEWLPDDPYPIADVHEWPDLDPDDDGLPALLTELAPRVRRAAALARELGDPVADPQQELSDDPLVAQLSTGATWPPWAMSTVSTCLPRRALGCGLELLRERLGDVETLLQFRLGSD